MKELTLVAKAVLALAVHGTIALTLGGGRSPVRLPYYIVVDCTLPSPPGSNHLNGLPA
jgi:hypothetical protein